jgi:hypothetical protein
MENQSRGLGDMSYYSEALVFHGRRIRMMSLIERLIEFVTRERFIVSFIALVLGGAATWAYASQFPNPTPIFGFSGMIGLASLLVGGLAGFLFGVPRWRASGELGATAERGRFLPNTNLEQVSDWLTKILGSSS